MTQMTFDKVFKFWLDSEIDQVEGRDLLPVAKSKGFNSISEWRLSTALRLQMDTKVWEEKIIEEPNKVLPDILIGPYQGWSTFFKNDLTTSFAKALEIKEFFEWCENHDRIIPIANNFPLPTSLILFRKPDGNLIHIEGGHRICAVAYKQKTNDPINFESKPKITAYIANITETDIQNLKDFLVKGTSK